MCLYNAIVSGSFGSSFIAVFHIRHSEGKYRSKERIVDLRGFSLVYRIRLNHKSESAAETSAMTAATAENRALISMFFFSSTSLVFRDW